MQGTRRQFGRAPRPYVRGEYLNNFFRSAPVAQTQEIPRDQPPQDPAPVSVSPLVESVEPAGASAAEAAISSTEMAARLSELMEVSETELRAVGEARAQAIRAWLLDTGKIAPERIFLAPINSTSRRVNLNLK